MTVRLAPAGVLAALPGGDDVHERLDRARLQQRQPMHLARRHGECGRHDDDVRAEHAQAMKQRRETNVVADGHADAGDGRVGCHDAVPASVVADSL